MLRDNPEIGVIISPNRPMYRAVKHGIDGLPGRFFTTTYIYFQETGDIQCSFVHEVCDKKYDKHKIIIDYLEFVARVGAILVKALS
jgi:hypothetical protein